MFVLNIFGVGEGLDIYYASNTINTIVLAVATGSINNALTPLLIKHFKENNLNSLKEVSISFFNFLLLTFFVLAVLQCLLARPILGLILPGFDKTKIETAVFFFRIQAFLSIITILTAVLRSLYYTYKKFYTTLLYPILGEIVQVLFVFLFYKKIGIYSLLYGLVINHGITFILFSIPFASFYRPRVVFNNEFKHVLKKIYPLLLSSSLSKSNILVDRFFASLLSSGSITILHYGDRFIKMILGFINKGISLVSLRKLSLEYDNDEKFRHLFYRINKGVVFIIIPVTFIIIFFFKEALHLMVVSNRLKLVDVNKIYFVVVALIGVFIGGSINDPITNAFFAKGLTSLISKTSIGIQLFGIPFKILFFYLFGFWGLPVAFSINSVISIIILYVMYYKYIGKYSIKHILLYLMKIIAVSSIAILIPQLLIKNIIKTPVLVLFIGTSVFVILFFLLSLVIEKEISRIILERGKKLFLSNKKK